MSFQWDAIDERERQKQERDRALKDFLLQQQQETRNRRRAERTGGIDPSRAPPLPAQAQAQQPPQRSTQFMNQYGMPQPSAAAPVAGPTASGPSSFNPYLSTPSRAPPLQLQIQPDMQPSAVSQDPTFYMSSIGFNSSTTDDVVSKLRLAEEQLQNERRSRSWLEAELQLGKQMLATLSAKVDKLQESHNTEVQSLREVARQAQQAEQKATSTAQELAVRVDRGQLKLSTTVSEMTARLKAFEQGRDEEREKFRLVSDELNALRYKLEGFSLQASEVGSEFKARTRDWEMEAQRGADALRAVRQHDQALETLHHTIDSSSEAVSKKVELALMEIRQRIDSEGRARFQFEHGMRELYGEVRKVLSAQDRDTNNKYESMKQQVIMNFEKERQERERNLAAVADQMRMLEKSIRESLQMAMDKMTSQVTNIEDVVNQEKQARSKFEGQIRLEMEEAFKIIQQAIVKKVDEIQQSQQEAKQSTTLALKALKESILLVEKAEDQKLHSLEDVLRAEIRSRMETDKALSDLKLVLETKSAEFERTATESIAEAVKEARDNILKVEDELKQTSEQLIVAKTQSIEDINNQVSLIRKRLKEDEVEIDTKFRAAQLATEQMGRDNLEALHAFELRVEEKFMASATSVGEVESHVKQAEELCGKVKTEMEEKINLRAVQLDSTLEAFKLDLGLRVTKKEASDVEARLDAAIGGVHATVGTLNQSLQSIRDNLENKATKKDLDESEARSKTQICALNTRFVDMDGSFIQLREEFAAKADKKDMETAESNLKTLIVNLQIKDIAIEELFERLQEDVNQRISPKQFTELEDRLRNYILNLETKDIELDQALSSVKEAISIRPTRSELLDSEKKVMTAVFGLQDRLGEVNASVVEAKTEISQTVRDDVQEMVASINGALDAVQNRADKLDNSIETLKIRISDSDANTRSRMQMVSSSLESQIAENVITIGKVKEHAAQQTQDLAVKIEDIPRQLKLFEAQHEEFRKKTLEISRGEAERFTSAISELRDAVSTKVEDKEFDALKTEMHTTLQRIGSQLEIASISADHARSKFMETEAISRERYLELRATQERAIDEQAISIRTMREAFGKKLEDVETKTSNMPRAIDQAWAELRKLRFDLDEKMRSDVSKLEKEVTSVKGEVAAKVSVRNMDATINSAITPISTKLDRVTRDVEDLKSAKLLKQSETSYSNVPNNIYKPQPLRGEGDIQLPPLPLTPPNRDPAYTTFSATKPAASGTGALRTGSRSGSTTNLTPKGLAPDPHLERLADMASGFNRSEGVDSPPSKEY